MQLVLSNLFQLNSGLFFFGRGFAKSCSDSSAISCPDGRIMPVIRCFSMVMFCKRGLRERALQEALFLAAEKKSPVLASRAWTGLFFSASSKQGGLQERGAVSLSSFPLMSASVDRSYPLIDLIR